MARATQQQSFWGAFASTGLYKKNQGRLTRQLTSLALGVILLFGCWTMSQTVLSSPPEFLLTQVDPAQGDGSLPPENFWEQNWSSIRYGVPMLLAAIGVWGIYRLVNYPRFTDFLISVEAEMDKVSWADQTYLVRATGVVLGTMLVLGAYLWACDLVWSWFFRLIGFLRLQG
ncbi:MAG: preprotein translocase subunit SecE [Planctomycetaceae bacterium]|nr:preprotein translocase subunit SecE [Planctomycetaceae bacterium]